MTTNRSEPADAGIGALRIVRLVRSPAGVGRPSFDSKFGQTVALLGRMGRALRCEVAWALPMAAICAQRVEPVEVSKF